MSTSSILPRRRFIRHSPILVSPFWEVCWRPVSPGRRWSGARFLSGRAAFSQTLGRTKVVSHMAITAPSGRFPPAWVPAAIALAWIGALAAAGDLGAPAYALPLLAAGAP